MAGEYILLLIVVLVLLGAAWFGICNTRTFNQRGVIRELAYAHPNWEAGRDAMTSVSYNQHLRALLLLRNPLNLYPEWLLVRPGEQRTQAWGVK